MEIEEWKALKQEDRDRLKKVVKDFEAYMKRKSFKNDDRYIDEIEVYVKKQNLNKEEEHFIYGHVHCCHNLAEI